MYVERMNKLTEQIITIRSTIAVKERSPPFKHHGHRRHTEYIEQLRLKAEYLEKRRLSLLRLQVID
jgi:hypothetical protein